MIDLEPRHLETVRRILARRVPECEVRAFGSRTAGTAKPYSDLDLAVVGPARIAPDAMRLLREDFEESDLPFRVDVLDWNGISESFRQAIQSHCEVVQQAGAPPRFS